jgi:hypothetical protein
LKTARPSLIEGLTLSSPTLPRSGTMRNGIVYRLPPLELPTSGTGYGLWRTPNASVVDAKSTVSKMTGRKPSDPQVGLADQVSAAEKGLWPTPTVNGNHNRKGCSQKSGDGLATAVSRLIFPTPRASDGSHGGPNQRDSSGRLGLSAIAAQYPTPAAQDAKNSTLPPSQRERDSVPGALLRSGEKPGGQMNPDWVEWLMGLPIGWTDLDASVTDKCRTAPISSGD